MNVQEIRIRDPFIYADKESGYYYMYGTTALNGAHNYRPMSLMVYRSRDLIEFDEPKIIFDGYATKFWAEKDYWAAEMHKYKGKFYLFVSFKSECRSRGTQILVSDTPDGTFVPLTERPVTPDGWECLDGTLYVEDGKPYIVFCREWLQVGDGEIWAMELSDDLTKAVGEPKKLFSASALEGVTGLRGSTNTNFVTDGPFLYHEGGKLRMLWSTFYHKKYSVLVAEADSLLGEWIQLGSHFDFDGGHAMIFETFEGKRMISLHAPNVRPNERPVFLPFD